MLSHAENMNNEHHGVLSMTSPEVSPEVSHEVSHEVSQDMYGITCAVSYPLYVPYKPNGTPAIPQPGSGTGGFANAFDPS